MSLDKIIAEIDEYLARLEMARDLLTAANRTIAHSETSTRQHRNRPMQPAAASRSRRTRRQTSKQPGTGTRANTKEDAIAESSSAPESSVRDAAAKASQLSAPAQVPALIPIDSVRPPLVKRLPQARATQRRTRPRTAVVKPSTDRPAIALGGSGGNRIVVISPEEARRAREHEAQAAPKPRFTRVIPSSGRQAFEALFGDESI